MKNIKHKFSILLLSLFVVMASCADLSVDNLNAPDRERALANDADLVSLIQGTSSDVFFNITDFWGVNINAYSDMMTTTNMVNSWWVFADEPRRAMPNVPTFADLVVNSAIWSDFNSGVQTANTIINIIENDGETIVVDGEDITQSTLTNAYFLRGVSKAYLGIIYDQAYDIYPDTDITSLEKVSYDVVLDAGIEDIEQAISLSQSIDGFTWSGLPTSDEWNQAEFQTIAYSLAARALAGKARTLEESTSLGAAHWQQVLDYADLGIGGDNAAAAMDGFIANTLGSYVYYNNLMDWHTYRVGESGYLPVDIMVQHLLDPNYPTAYPVEDNVFLAEEDWNPTDPRGAYYSYTSTRFAQSADRNKANFSQYNFEREWAGNNWGTTGQPLIYFLAAETDYLKTEAYLMLGDKGSAAMTLNASPFGTGVTDFSPDLPAKVDGRIAENGISGENTILATASDAEFQYALLREYAIEISLMGGIGNQWFFMRRWDMLQTGTPLQYPIPADELEITGDTPYTFGGVSNAGEPGTASGANSWKDLVSKIDTGSAFFSNSATSQSQAKAPFSSVKSTSATQESNNANPTGRVGKVQ
ncbi:MAG: hypothetical protein WEA58_06540 [Balneolaceae bacterium]